MPHVVVGGDNDDAYAICGAIEKQGIGDGLPVVFCTTPQEVVTSLSQADVALFVLHFEQAGLTNFELACRLRENPAGAETPILLPEVDVLGDLGGTLGKHVGVVAYPVDPEDVAAQAVALIKAAAAAAVPVPPSTAANSTSAASVPRAAGGTAAPVSPADGAAPADGSRSHRVRHRTWKEVRNPRPRRPEPVPNEEPSAAPFEGKAAGPAAGSRGARRGNRQKLLDAVDPALLRVVLIVAGLALPVFSFYACRAYRSVQEERLAASQAPQVDVMCSSCGHREQRQVNNIHDLRCRTCGKPMGFTFRCQDCKKDFAVVPPPAIRKLTRLRAPPPCAQCKSAKVAAVPVATAGPAEGKAASGSEGHPAKKAPDTTED